ncbi:MAG: histone deacetylase [Ignavibacteria bacterium]|nr:histone deacetylase [Ignavibacteria bacterium]
MQQRIWVDTKGLPRIFYAPEREEITTETEQSEAVPRPAFLFHDSFLLHTPPQGHPERPDRLKALIRTFRASDLWTEMDHIGPVPCEEKHLLLCHTENHCSFIRRTCESGGGLLDGGDTHCVEASYEAATRAVGAVTGAVDAVAGNGAPFAFCAVRPPGHHAERDQPMGFCLFNNAAIGARYAQKHHGVGKVAILDWDVHHGNGTQHIFEEDPTVMYISLHQFPFYPGTGAAKETGKGDGRGFTLNIPLPAGSSEEAYLKAFNRMVIPALERFHADLLILSAGFDAHVRDPLGEMMLTEQSFARMTSLVMHGAPIVSVLEGGYDLDALSRSAEAHVRTLLQRSDPVA